KLVTGVQTCALPICRPADGILRPAAAPRAAPGPTRRQIRRASMNRRAFLKGSSAMLALSALTPHVRGADAKPLRVGLIGSGWYEIGRASCRERGWIG